MNEGYSGRPLAQKLGIKSGFRICLINTPSGYSAALTGLPENVQINDQLSGDFDLIQVFSGATDEVAEIFPSLKKHIKSRGMIWISWPKKSSGVSTDLDGNLVRKIGLENGMVDVKVCAIDQIWSGLKFVFRLEDR